MSADAGPAKAAEEKLAGMSRARRIASLFMLHLPGTDEGALRSFVADTEPGGMIFMPDNIGASLTDVASLARAAREDEGFPPLIGIDQEGGRVRRIADDRFASAVTLRHRDPEETREAFAARSALLAEAGISVNFGVVADVTDDPGSFMNDRVLGTTAAEAAERVSAAITGESGRVFSTLKHFPGHGRTPGDSHSSIPETAVDLATWEETDAAPFRSGILAGADFVMMGHLRYSTVDDQPATLSRAWHSILRERLGFEGVIITDDMLMLGDSGVPEYRDAAENAVRALAAGATMLLYVLRGDPEQVRTDAARLVQAVSNAVDAGRLSIEHIDAAALTLLTLRARLARPRGIS
ncbi:glycoside hydrolase family 3 N-terminal domain-containing protein [Mycetocola zhujimingii]|uniref:beta-N-acetylhexosaminidase n=1 Tax=Mycetocola zhujimingii TaxID=2079792 RepID=A0A2U1THB9_9MICO|nr:glycoside hydrolase family 3 N-terminal domain-containing protein [Mycetocola zhujimingii]PWC08173.1 glycosyl hydrolase family 3 [Mycetocola zhujimingii]